MIEGHPRGDAAFQTEIDDTIVILNAVRVNPSGSIRKNTGPRNGEPIVWDVHGLHQQDVLFVSVVKITGNLGVVPIENGIFLCSEAIPDRRPLTMVVMSTFNLIGCGGYSPSEIFTKIGCVQNRFFSCFQGTKVGLGRYG